MQHNLITLIFFVVLQLISPILVYAEIQECVNRGEGKITCPPLSSSSRAVTPQAAQPQSFTGRVTQILDHRTLEVTSQGTTMRIHIRPVEDTSKEDLAAIALHQDVIGNIRNIDADGLPIADVALRNGENLREALRQRQRQKPEVHARYERKREEEARLRQQAAEADSNQRAAAPFEGRVVKVLDGQTLQVLRQGNPVPVRVRDIPTHVSKDRIHELVSQQTVIVIVYNRTPDGMFIGEVILPTGQSLSQAVAPADVAAKYDKPPVSTVVPTPPASIDIDPRTQCDEVMKGKTKSDRSYQPIYGPCCNDSMAMKSKEAMEKCIGQRGAEEMLRMWRNLGVKSP
jgi:endonuclease YncB( thermonuclease family)